MYDFILNNPDGLSAAAGRNMYLAEQGAGVDIWLRENAMTMSDKALIEAAKVWDEHVEDAQLLPPIMDIAEEYAQDYSAKYNDIETYVNEMTSKFIMGEIDINDNTWNEFQQTITDLGIEDCIRWQQDALDRYNERDITVGY